MSKVAIVSDSNSGITQSMAKELGVTVMPMPFFVGDFIKQEVDNYLHIHADVAEVMQQKISSSSVRLTSGVLTLTTDSYVHGVRCPSLLRRSSL